MRNTLESRLGIFFFLAVVAAVLIVEVIGGADFLRPGYRIRARFANIHELKVGDAVKMAGVPVGRVEKIALATNEPKVEVELRLNKNTPVHTDSKATIKSAGLTGQNYVSIDFGSPNAPLLEPNELIATVEQPDFNDMMARLDQAASGVENLTKSFTGDKIDNLLGPFTDFMRQNNPKLTAMIGNMQNISAQVAKGEGTVGKLIYDQSLYNSASAAMTNFQDVANEMKGTLGDARGMIDQARGMLTQVNNGQGSIGKLLKDDKLYNETTDSMINLREILQKINQGQGSVGKLVNDQTFLKDAQLSLQKLDKATESLEDTGPLSILGSIVTTFL